MQTLVLHHQESQGHVPTLSPRCTQRMITVTAKHTHRYPSNISGNKKEADFPLSAKQQAATKIKANLWAVSGFWIPEAWSYSPFIFPASILGNNISHSQFSEHLRLWPQNCRGATGDSSIWVKWAHHLLTPRLQPAMLLSFHHLSQQETLMKIQSPPIPKPNFFFSSLFQQTASRMLRNAKRNEVNWTFW